MIAVGVRVRAMRRLLEDLDDHLLHEVLTWAAEKRAAWEVRDAKKLRTRIAKMRAKLVDAV